MQSFSPIFSEYSARYARPVLCLAAALLCVAASAQYPRHELLRMMRSGDAKERAIARQLLPREGVEVVDDVLPALADPSEPVWRTASNILTDLGNELSSPGFAAERVRYSDLLLARLAVKPNQDEAARLLRIVPIALPEGTDVAPVAAYLVDPELRVNARDALQLAGTTESKAALRSALDGADGTFALALIDALDKLRDPAARKQLTARMRDRDPAIRAAAARALAWTGDTSLISAYRDVIKNATPATRIEAGNAILLLADAVATRGGQYDFAMDQYHWTLQNLDGPVLKGAAMASMGRYGDDRVVPWILEAAASAPAGTLDHGALEAFAALKGDTCAHALVANHEALLKQFGPSIYAAYGRRPEEIFLSLLLDAINSDDASTRHVVTLALLDTDRPQAIQVVAQRGAALEGEPRAALINTLELKAAKFRRANNAAAAGAAYAGLYKLATTDEDRRFALDGMMQYPSEEAFALVKDLIGQDQLAELSVPFLAGIARALYTANRPDDAGRILDSVVSRITTSADMQAFMGAVQGGGPELAKKLGFVSKWHVIGPFPWSMADGFSANPIGAPEVDLAASYPAPNGDPRAWKAHEAGGANAMVELTGLLGAVSNAAAYAYAEIDAPEAADITVRAGSDDGIKIWINGEAVHEHNVDRGMAVDQDQAPAKLTAGVNRILVQITQGAGGWNFCLRLTHRDGRPVVFTQ